MISIKQNITKQDLLQLNDNQIKALFTYWWKTPPVKKNLNTSYARCEYDTGYLLDLPLMSIGDMIEYLIYNKDQNFTIERYLQYEGVDFEEMIWEVHDYIDPELCDCLWELTKEYLNR